MATQTATPAQDLPNGPVAAALLAGGIGATTLALLTVLSEVSAPFSSALNWWNPAGPLTGKALTSVIVFIGSWIALHLSIGKKNVNFNTYAIIALVMLGLGLLGTFPPFFDLFKGG